jgi:hypothetical protein
MKSVGVTIPNIWKNKNMFPTSNMLWMKEILHHQKDGSEPINTGMFITYQLVQDILFHQQYHWLVVYLPL